MHYNKQCRLQRGDPISFCVVLLGLIVAGQDKLKRLANFSADMPSEIS